MENLDSFLQEHRAEGVPAEEGSFTINAARAMDLVGEQSQPFAEAWVLKLVQAACVENCLSLLVTQDSTSSTFAFQGATWTWAEVSEALGRGAKGGRSSLDHLARALLWLAKGTAHTFSLRLAEGHCALWDGAEFHVQQAESTEVALCVQHSSGPLLWGLLARRGLDLSVSIATILHQRAHTSSVPLYLDTWHLAGLHHNRRLSGNPNIRPLAVLTSPPSQTLPGFAMSLTHDWEKVESGPEIHLRGHEPEEESCNGIVTLLAAFTKERKVSRGIGKTQLRSVADSGGSYLVWVLDGVVIAEEALKVEAPIGFVTAVSAAGLRTDLSGFGLVQSEELMARRRAALRALREQIAEICLDTEMQIDVATQGGTFLKVQVASAAIGLLIFFPVGVLFAVNAYQVSKEETEHEKDMEKIYRLGLVKLRDGVAALSTDRV